jgi:hypothetical protein
VPEREELVLSAHASGFQVYDCQAGPDGHLAWLLKGPEAELLDDQGAVIGHHYAGPSWKHNDGSIVVGKMQARVDSPDPGAIPWLLVTTIHHSGTGVFSHVSTIQRLHTQGGQPPSADSCSSSHRDLEAKSKYTADYYFYAPAH